MCSSCVAGQSCSLGACTGAAVGGGTTTGGGAATGGGTAAGGGTATGGGASTGGGSANTSLVFNEICARGSDFLELYNAGTTPKNLTGYLVTDSQDDAGVPKLDTALAFPAGTTVAPNQFLLVVLNQPDAGATTSCLDGGPSSCFAATFKVSNSRGETVWLIAPGGGVEQQASYPANAAASGKSYGRIPDGTGGFVETATTPGAQNHQ